MPARLAICLFDEAISNLDPSLLLAGQPLTKLKVAGKDKDVLLYLKDSANSTPDWVEIVKGFSDVNPTSTLTASSGAILFLKIGQRIVGCCFGSSVGNINRDNLITDFGLAVAYRRINKQNYKGIETLSLQENPITNHRSAAMPANQTSFNLDSYLENITELSGKHYTKVGGQLIKGKEFLSVPAPLTLPKIIELCDELVVDYKKTISDPTYKELTAVSKVKTKKLIDYLNHELCNYLNKHSEEVYLVDYANLSDISSYTLTLKGKHLPELEIASLYKDLKAGQKFTVDFLKSRRITVYNEGGQMIDGWSLLKCLFLNLKINIGGYILYKGNWYEVQKRYLNDLKSFLTSYEVDRTVIGMPKWDGNADEGDYNIMAAAKVKGQCWDKTLYRHPDFSHGIEFCDVLLPDQVIHVKKLSSSALNSHLLLQTLVSAQLLKSDPSMKIWISATSLQGFKKNIFLKKSNEFQKRPITYVIALMANNKKKKTVAESLPFFSLISFNLLIRRITQLDFQVKVCLV